MRWFLVMLLVAVAAAAQSPASLSGVVRGGGIPLPGATVSATQGKTRVTILSGNGGDFSFSGLAPGACVLRVTMPGFTPIEERITVPAGGLRLTLAVAPLAHALSAPQATPPPVASVPGAGAALAVNGSVRNDATSQFGLSPAFGNHRPGVRSLFNGAVGLIFDNSHLDARSYSFAGNTLPKPEFSNLTGLFQLGGPLLIPHLDDLGSAPFFFLGYQKTADSTATASSALVPTPAERAVVTNPQAASLLSFYPLPNLAASEPYNYQASLLSHQHEDQLQTRVNKAFAGPSHTGISEMLSLASTRADATNLFGFLDNRSTLGLNSNTRFRRSFAETVFMTFGFDYSRLAQTEVPYFAARENVEAAAEVQGASAVPSDWGPPTLSFANGIAGLSDALPMHNRNQTAAASVAGSWAPGNHNFEFGGDFRRLEFNLLQQQNPRGNFSFTGAATGSAWGDFAAGEPDTASLDFGNADKYFRQNQDDVYFTDDWSARDGLSLDLGARWEYASPASELYGRMVNLVLTPGFASASPVLASPGNPLLRPDRGGFEPRLGIAWRPWEERSLLLRAGYGMYRNSSVYEDLALQMAAQPPFATVLNTQNSPAQPLTLATALLTPASGAPASFAVNPDFRMGYVQAWNASLQNSIGAGTFMTLSYLGEKGTRGVQEFYPNTYPPGAANPCPARPLGFLYETSNGDSSYDAGTASLERRLHSGLAFQLSYTFSHALDDMNTVAQNWRALDAERARSDFDQPQVLKLQAQYSSGLRWRSALVRGWTVLSAVTAASGEPLTPTTLIPIPGTAFAGVRPDVAPGGAFVLPAPESWGDAGRNSMTAPGQLTLNGSLQRAFPLRHGLTAALRIDATNLLNHPVFTGLYTLVGSPQFGLPSAADAMRSLQTTLRITF
ncbi:MAG: carboxypeptidase regulatory-like domain-containing protein [Terriglobales bacterium]